MRYWDLNDNFLTIAEFCAKHGICRATFYNMRGRGEAPATERRGRKLVITAEAERVWKLWEEANLTGEEVASLVARAARVTLPKLMREHGTLPGAAIFVRNLETIAEALGAALPAGETA
jgi:predicted DNA-binding transcriptional regulator AlpA